jgi:hypothetical protein
MNTGNRANKSEGKHIMIASKFKLDKIFIVMTAIVIAYICMTALINISFGIDSEMMVKAFDVDEYLILRILRYNVLKNVLTCGGIYEHGITYQGAALLITKSLMHLGYVISDRLLILVLRVLSLLFFMLILVLSYTIMRRLNNSSIISLLAVSFVASMPELGRYAGTAHPDTLQLLLIMCSFAIAISNQSFAYAFLAASVCGIAMATKMGSLTLLPFLILPATLHYFAGMKGTLLTLKSVRHLVMCSFVAMASFAITFCITFPQVLSNEFVERVRILSSIARAGYGKVQESANPLLWFPVINKQYSIMGSLLILLGIIAIIRKLHAANQAATLKQGIIDLIDNESDRAILSIAAYVVCSLVFVMIFVKWREARHIFAVLVFVALLGFTGVGYLTTLLKKQWQRMLLYALILGVSMINSYFSVKMLSRAANKYESPAVAASQWIIQNYGFNVPLIGDLYTYIPPEMNNSIMKSDFIAKDLAIVINSKATLITLSHAASGRFAWMKEGTSLRDGQIVTHSEVDSETASKFARFLQEIASNQSVWKLVYENDGILVIRDTAR